MAFRATFDFSEWDCRDKQEVKNTTTKLVKADDYAECFERVSAYIENLPCSYDVTKIVIETVNEDII